jgi:hypothetical protein
MYRVIRRELLVLGLVLTAACGDNTVTPPTPTTPTTGTSVTDTFEGTLNRNGGRTHSFAVPSAGPVTATLVTLGPNSALVIGLSLGTWNGTACNVVLANDQATQGSTVTGNIGSAGNLCVRVYDVGNIVDPVSYQITAAHP